MRKDKRAETAKIDQEGTQFDVWRSQSQHKESG